jgi:circadian clock protein KaiB
MMLTPRASNANMAQPETVFRFRLYVAGDAQNSIEALGNLHRICDRYLLTRHVIEVVDVFLDPKRALADGIFMTPALVMLFPLPSRRIIGTLSQTQTVLQSLGLVGGTT